MPLLRNLTGAGITLSVDTLHPGVLDICLKHDIHAANDIAGFLSPAYAEKVADAGIPAFVMAANSQPGDPVGVGATLAALEGVMRRCEAAGGKRLRARPRCRHPGPPCARSMMTGNSAGTSTSSCVFDRPVLGAVSRKTFIGMLLNRIPEERPAGHPCRDRETARKRRVPLSGPMMWQPPAT